MTKVCVPTEFGFPQLSEVLLIVFFVPKTIAEEQQNNHSMKGGEESALTGDAVS
jgi:hypothetical protein